MMHPANERQHYIVTSILIGRAHTQNDPWPLYAENPSLMLLHKSHNSPVPYLTMHHFVSELCTRVHISVRKWCIMGYLPDALQGLWDGLIGKDWLCGASSASIIFVKWSAEKYLRGWLNMSATHKIWILLDLGSWLGSNNTVAIVE